MGGRTVPAARPESHAPPRSPWRLTLARFRHDHASVVAAVVLAVIVLSSLAGGPLASRVLGHGASEPFPYAVDVNLRPVGPWTRVPAVHAADIGEDGLVAKPPPHAGSALLVLGADGPLGRDELLRLLDGGKTSLEIALGGVLVALLVGAPLGCLGGFFGGVLDAAVVRATELVMAFPLILLLVLVSVRIGPSLSSIGVGGVVPGGVVAVSLVIGLFTWFYPARLARAEAMTLRHAQFVEAGRMVGASEWRILRRHLLPHVVPVLLVWAAVAAGTNILLEVGISFLGVGVGPSTPTWGSLLSTTWGTIFAPRPYDAATFTPWLTIFPTGAILLAVASLNQVGEGLRRALDPRALA